MAIKDDPQDRAVTAPAMPEVIVIPSYDTPGDVFPGWVPLPPFAAPVAAAAPAPVEVDEPELDYTICTFDDRLATGLVTARYVLFALIAALGAYGAYSVLSMAAANVVTIILAVALIAGVASFFLRLWGALSVVSERCSSTELAAFDEDLFDDIPAAVRPSAGAGQLAGRPAFTAPGSPVTLPAGRADGVEIGQGREFDELTGSWEAWDGWSTPSDARG